MFYYEIAVGGRAKGKQPFFTYSSACELAVGLVVRIEFGNAYTLGFIVKKASIPTFKTKPVAKSFDYLVPEQQVSTYLALIKLYPYSGQLIAQLFLPPQINKTHRPPKFEHATQRDLLTLNEEQQNTYDSILQKPETSIIFGETGSGKTRLYTHLARHYTDTGKTVVLLTPEIGLASYIYQEMSLYFAEAILYHSELTKKERADIWQHTAKHAGGMLIIGPRSALTLPLKNIGLIILDEAHDQAYRQDSYPYVHARTVAALLAREHKTYCLYGTATPSVADIYNAKELGVPILRMDKLAISSEHTTNIQVISPSDDSSRHSSGLLLPPIREQLAETFKHGNQAMILMNKRGTARYVSCETCGLELRCKNCDHLLAYHHDTFKLLCHICGANSKVPTSCPDCGATSLSMRSLGAKAVEQEVLGLYPRVSVRRFDTDTSKKDHLSRYTSELKNGEIQAIIGTQMVAKGLDLPSLETLVVLGGGASIGGFSGEEKEFQLLYQVIGRALRGHRQTTVLIQSAHGHSSALRAAVARDYGAFYDHEINERRLYHYPPFVHLGIIYISRATAASCEKAGNKLITELRTIFKEVEFIGPIANIHERRGKKYNWHILMKAKNRRSLVMIVEHLGTSYTCELDPIDTP